MVVVHAAWHAASADRLRNFTGSVRAAYAAFTAEAKRQAIQQNMSAETAEMNEQNSNPVKVATSGLEGYASKPFFAGGKLRRLERLQWWNNYTAADGRMVVIGHYWRRFMEEIHSAVPPGFTPSGADMFPGYAPQARLGPARKVICVDFAVGVRYEERGMRLRPGGLGTHLGALRVPEMSIVIEDGRTMDCT